MHRRLCLVGAVLEAESYSHELTYLSLHRSARLSHQSWVGDTSTAKATREPVIESGPDLSFPPYTMSISSQYRLSSARQLILLPDGQKTTGLPSQYRCGKSYVSLQKHPGSIRTDCESSVMRV